MEKGNYYTVGNRDNRSAELWLRNGPGFNTGPVRNSGTEKSADFVMLPSNGLPSGVLKTAKADVHVRSVGPVEIMEVFVQGLPPIPILIFL